MTKINMVKNDPSNFSAYRYYYSNMLKSAKIKQEVRNILFKNRGRENEIMEFTS